MIVLCFDAAGRVRRCLVNRWQKRGASWSSDDGAPPLGANVAGFVSRGSMVELVAMQKENRNHTKAVIECAVSIVEECREEWWDAGERGKGRTTVQRISYYSSR